MLYSLILCSMFGFRCPKPPLCTPEDIKYGVCVPLPKPEPPEVPPIT